MHTAVLFSGGKDSTYAAYLLQRQGHDIKYLISFFSLNPDSYMFHTVNIEITELQAKAWGKKFIKVETKGEKEKELLDLQKALSVLDIDGLISGAIASNYQKARIDKVCKDLGLVHFAPLWGKPREELLKEMIDIKMDVLISSVAALGFSKEWLGRTLNNELIEKLLILNEKFGVDPCGEGGEYESLVLDAPWFLSRIKINKSKKVWDGSAGKYIVIAAELIPKKLHKD
jgi:ABC transporter with metal-binding/Fe-S-binding domain ATP-binding protein